MNQAVFSRHEALGKWYNPVFLSPATIFHRAQRDETMENVLKVLDSLEPDDYSRYVSQFYREGMENFSTDWRYLDILTVLHSVTQLLKPTAYLEIGVRRGRSMAMVSACAPQAALYGFDMWMEGYAGMENPGGDFVTGELQRLGHQGSIEFVNGNSHQTLKEFFAKNPDQMFDLITVDGDHSDKGAYEDIRDVLPRVSPGGVVVFDDVSHPAHPNLADVWLKALRDSKLPFSEARYTDLGYGVAVAVRNI